MAAVAVMSHLPAMPDQRPELIPRTSSSSTASMKQSRPLKAHVKTNSTSDVKKPRSERPCDGCRKRKSKCVINDSSPPCVTCKFHKQECTFLEGPLPRKRKLDDGGENGAPRSRTQRANGAHDSNGYGSDGLMHAYTDHIRERAPLDVNAILDDTLSLQRHRHCRYVGSSSPFDTFLLSNCHFDSGHETQLACGDIRQVADDVFFEMLPDAAFGAHDEEVQSLYEIEQLVGPYGPALIELYFEKVHAGFPVIQKQVFLDTHNHGDRQFSPALLASMYILALGWWDHDPTLAQQPMPSIDALENVAFSALGIAMQQPKLSSVQAGLLLLQRQQTNAWPLTVQVISLAQDLGLHLDCSAWAIPLWERRLRKLLAWTIYMQDKWSCLVFGRPSQIHVSTWAVQPLTLEDFDEEVQTTIEATPDVKPRAVDSTNATIFLQMVELTSIMAEVVKTFYTQAGIADITRAGTHATQVILAKAKPVQLKLKEWFARLPAEAKLDADMMETAGDGEQRPISAAHLHLAYFATEISIHRRIVQSLAVQHTPPASPAAASENYTLYICRSAAKTRLISAMDFVNRLRPDQLDAFWYFASGHNFALIATFGNLLRATSPGHEEAAFYESRLSEYRWALTVSARRAGWIAGAVATLDVTAAMLADLPDKPRSGQVTPAASSSGRADSAHARDRAVAGAATAGV